MPRSVSGFTVLELLVTLSIIAVLLTVIIFNQAKYTEAAALSNLADDLGLSFSQAQAYGIGVREFSAGSANFSSAYGLTLSLLSSGSNSAALFFADRGSGTGGGDRIYNGDWSCPISSTSECLEKKRFTRGNYLFTLCVVPLSGADDCSVVRRADVVFVRPNPEAQIRLFDGNGSSYTPSNWKGVKFVLKSPSGLSRTVTVYKSGQISAP